MAKKSTSEAEKSFLEADFDFFWTNVLDWSENTQKSSFALFFTLIPLKMADLAQKKVLSIFRILKLFSAVFLAKNAKNRKNDFFQKAKKTMITNEK